MQETNPQETSVQKLNLPTKFLPTKPLTRHEIRETARERISLIAQEFSDGFRFLQKYPRSVTFFGGARFTEDSAYYQLARTIASAIVRETGYAVITGGGPGIMEAANRGAHEAGGASLGLTIEIPNGQAVNPYITRSIDFYYFFARKVCMSFSAEAYLFFPGGFGTLDEMFEIITLVQTHKIEHVPVILVGSDFWNPIKEMMRKELLARGTIDEQDLTFFTITDDPNEILDIIKKAPIHNGIAFRPQFTTKEETNGELTKKKCIPCEGDTAPFDHGQSEKMLHHLNQWVLVEDSLIEKTTEFKDFREAFEFVSDVARLAEKEGHHPDIQIFSYDKVRIALTTHAIHGLSENDFIMAAKIDEILRNRKAEK